MAKLEGWIVVLAVAAASCHSAKTVEDGGADLSGEVHDGGALGTDAGAATLSIVPDAQDFLSVPVGVDGAATTFTVMNSGTVASGALSVTPTGADFVKQNDDCAGNELAAGSSCTVVIVFHPTTTGPRSGTLTVAAANASATATLTGVGLQPSSLTVTPSSYAFGGVHDGQTAMTSMTVHNGGDVDAGTLTLTLTGTDAAQFALSGDTCSGKTLAAGASCTVTVKFTPKSHGNKSAALSVSATVASPTSATLSGIGQAPAALSIAPTSKDFGTVNIGTKPTFEFVITNTGDIKSGACTATIGGDASFTVTNNGCATGVQPGTPCDITVQFAPTTLGSKSGSLTVGDGTVSAKATLAGTGDSPPHLTLSPTSYDFQSQSVGGTLDYSFTVQNTGAEATGALTNSVAAPFSITATTCPSTGVAAGASCSVTVRYTATSGTSKGTLTVAATPGGTATASLSGTGVTSCAAASASAMHFVDGANGTDNATHGGAYGGCAYKTITYALTQATGQIAIAAGTYSTAETYPLALSGSQSLLCDYQHAGTPATLLGRAAEGGGDAFTLILEGDADVVSNCVVDGSPGGTNPGYCIIVEGSAGANSNQLTGGTITNCYGDAIFAIASVSVSGVTFSGNSLGGIAVGVASITATLTDNTFSESGTPDILCVGADPQVTGSGNKRAGGAPTCQTCANCSF